METTLEYGKVDYNGTGRKINAVDIEIDLSERDGSYRLSICGNIWNARHTDILSCGQNLEEIAELLPRNREVQRIVEIWRVWHLNDMKAGCEHQRAEGWDKRPIDPFKPTNTYGKHGGVQRDSWNLLGWVRPDEHPDGLLTKPCPECGYRYGTAWKVEELPSEIVEEVKRLIEKGEA